MAQTFFTLEDYLFNITYYIYDQVDVIVYVEPNYIPIAMYIEFLAHLINY